MFGFSPSVVAIALMTFVAAVVTGLAARRARGEHVDITREIVVVRPPRWMVGSFIGLGVLCFLLGCVYISPSLSPSPLPFDVFAWWSLWVASGGVFILAWHFAMFRIVIDGPVLRVRKNFGFTSLQVKGEQIGRWKFVYYTDMSEGGMKIWDSQGKKLFFVGSIWPYYKSFKQWFDTYATSATQKRAWYEI